MKIHESPKPGGRRTRDMFKLLGCDVGNRSARDPKQLCRGEFEDGVGSSRSSPDGVPLHKVLIHDGPQRSGMSARWDASDRESCRLACALGIGFSETLDAEMRGRLGLVNPVDARGQDEHVFIACGKDERLDDLTEFTSKCIGGLLRGACVLRKGSNGGVEPDISGSRAKPVGGRRH